MSDNLAAKVTEFCSRLRSEHGFAIGPRETREALRAMELVGVEERSRVAAALRAVCCSRPEEVELFDRAFAAFFSTAPFGVEQPQHAQRRRSRPDRRSRREETAGAPGERPLHAVPRDEGGIGGLSASTQPEALDLAQTWQMRRARYSPIAASSEAIAIPTDGLDAALAQARRLVRRLSLVPSRRWTPKHDGERFDLRRTLRASLRTGGDVIVPHTLGHRPFNPRFVLLLDGSRSMSEYGGRALQFAHALCRSTRRASVFLFSTKLREVTRRLREAGRSAPYRLDDLGEAWGGGTRIGASLTQCVRKHGARLNDRTFAIVISDGLDVGDIAQLKWAMRELARRCAAVAWVNPLAGEPEYAPSARGMRAALPYVTALASLDDIDALANLGRRRRLAIGA
jgi:uncharacterized protein with von Willebrand factor type A (vWA) domain